MKKKYPPIHRTVTTQHNGKTCYGNYMVDGQLLTVTYGMATKSALLHGVSAEALASLLLSELLLAEERGF